MTPKEKAKSIYKKYLEFEFTEFVSDEDAAKQCALIVVNEILSVLSDGYTTQRIKDYWLEVKSELEAI